MENNRGQSIFLSVVGIATLLVAIVGATFAYFSITAVGNENASSIHVTTAKLGDVVYSGNGGQINIENTYPGWHDQTSFTISTASGTTGTIQYQINLVVDNGQLPTADTRSEFIYSLSGNATNNAAGTVIASLSNQKVPSTTTTLATGTIVNEDTHSYDLSFLLKETGSSQDDLQGKAFTGHIQIVVSTAQGMRTYDTNASGWKEYTNSDIKTSLPVGD